MSESLLGMCESLLQAVKAHCKFEHVRSVHTIDGKFKGISVVSKEHPSLSFEVSHDYETASFSITGMNASSFIKAMKAIK